MPTTQPHNTQALLLHYTVDTPKLLASAWSDVCLVEKEVWTEIYMPRQVEKGLIMTNVQEKYEVVIDDPKIEETLEANIPLGKAALGAAIQEYKDHISFEKR